MTADLIYSLLSDTNHYDMQVTIESVVYAFRLYFEDVDGYWQLTILDESATVVLAGPRRLLAVGPWLTVDDPLTISQLLQLYDLSAGLFSGGGLLAVSPLPLAGVQADAAMLELHYFSAATIAAAVAGA